MEALAFRRGSAGHLTSISPVYTLIAVATIQKKVSRGRTYWQIVESRRVNGKPRPIVLQHLGSAEKLLQRLRESPTQPVKAQVIQFGALAALWQIAQELDVVGLIDAQVPKRDQGLSCGQYMLLAALNRCVAAASKASLYQWYRRTVLRRLLPTGQRTLASQRFWDHMQRLDSAAISAVEQQIAARVIDRYQIDLRMLIFDATNFDTFIDSRTVSELAQRGHAKSKRADLRILGLALLVSADYHVPLLSHPYPGNQNDAALFSSLTETLLSRCQQLAAECEDITLVFDGGNTSKENIEALHRSRYHFITSLTVTQHEDLLAIPLRRFHSFADPRLAGVTAYRTHKQVWGQRRTVLVTISRRLLEGQLAGINRALRKKRSALRTLRDKLARSQQPGARGRGYSRASVEKHLGTITSGQYVAQILKTQISETDGVLSFRFHTDWAAYQRLKRGRLGKRILCTDNESWSDQEIILASRAQHHVERAFKQMKNPHWVSFSPAFHWTDQKLRVHVFYCVLALLLSSLLQRKAAHGGHPLTIEKLLAELSGVTELVNLYAAPDQATRGRYRAHYVLSERSSLQDKLCRILDVYQHVHGSLRNALSVYKQGSAE